MRLITLAPNLAPLLSGSVAMGAMGIMDFMEDDESAEGESNDDDLFDDDLGGDDFGDLDDSMDGGMDDWGDGGGDGFGDMGGGSTQELENRLQDLENEVGDIASTVSTVRSENEQISEKVDDVEENVRKLLEIYEMVTRGVNPFVDDVPNGGLGGDAFGGGGDDGFGLFDEEEEDDEEDLDDDVADADAESFFDDTFDDIEEDDMDDIGMDDMDEMEADEAMEDDESDGQAGGSTFQELKDEYESGEADWAEEGDSDEAESEIEFDVEPEEVPETEPEPEQGTSEALDTGEFEFEEPTQTDESQAAETTMAMRNGMQKPYLATLPAGYIVDLVVMEWLEFLVEEFGSEDAVRTIGYYEDIDWISEPVEEQLLGFARGIADVSDVDTDATPATLSVDDHIRSLSFMSQLTGDAIEQKVVDHCAGIRGEGNGLQR
ncbi:MULTISPECIES: FlaD/FlaE family flagellar protein [unclassified Haladaptatus]|uniref:FlaD/FlaE family flagellar protein n=1 Tax=unclassified Haladaptatus TaxID=2622732 RepID=UPI00209BD8BF|nr:MULTISPECIES: FlaD/FlaE family flagellar protein [unclassified Haladaptatus]MCO8245252.1 fla cluster protein flaCE [Haladaptatus sp. AB643]MCO8253396.1 fla cluster protein flaCE [Haladaptatus sp. AB618]